MSKKSKELETNKVASVVFGSKKFRENVIFTFQSIFFVALVLFASAVTVFIGSEVITRFIKNGGELDAIARSTSVNEMISYGISVVVLLSLTYISSGMTFEILELRKKDLNQSRAIKISIVIGLVVIYSLFKQSYLETLFADLDTSTIIEIALAIFGAGSGWVAWYLKHVTKYGELFHVFLLTIVVGFGWYARFTTIEQVQLLLASFIIGSFVHLAKDYADKSDENINKKT